MNNPGYSDRVASIPAGGSLYAISASGFATREGASWQMYVNQNAVARGVGALPSPPISAVPTTIVAAALADSPEHYYAFADTTPVLVDQGSVARNGVYNEPFVQSLPGPPGDPTMQAASFYWNGGLSVGSVMITGTPIDLSGCWSVEFWLRDPQRPQPYALISKLGHTFTLGPVSNTSGGPTYVSFNPYVGTSTPPGPFRLPLPDLNWHHICWTYNGSTLLTGYIDGQIAFSVPSFVADVSQEASAATATITPVTLTTGLACFTGLGIYTSALSSSQVRAHFAAGYAPGTNASQESFVIPLNPGWNEIDVLIYQAPRTLDDGVTTALLFQPDLYTWSPSSSWPGAPQLLQYPLAAAPAPLPQVSEFQLGFNLALQNREAWAWRTDPTGTVGEVALLNHLPAATTEVAMDGFNFGADPL